MSTTKQLTKLAAIVAAFISGFTLGLVGIAAADNVPGNVVIMLTRLNSTISTWPRNDAFNVGATSTPSASAKLSVVLNSGETYKNAFELASTTPGASTSTTDLLRVNNQGCINAVATSTATQIKLTFNATSTQGATNNGVVDWSYGSCTP